MDERRELKGKNEDGSSSTNVAGDPIAQMRDLAEKISQRLGGLDVEVDISYADRKWYRPVPSGKVLIDGGDLLKFLQEHVHRP